MNNDYLNLRHFPLAINNHSPLKYVLILKLHCSEAYLRQTPNMHAGGFFEKVINDFKPLSIFAKKLHCVKSVQIRIFFFGPYFPLFGLNSKSPYSVRIQENTDQKKLRIWTLFTQCFIIDVWYDPKYDSPILQFGTHLTAFILMIIEKVFHWS